MTAYLKSTAASHSGALSTQESGYVACYKTTRPPFQHFSAPQDSILTKNHKISQHYVQFKMPKFGNFSVSKPQIEKKKNSSGSLI